MGPITDDGMSHVTDEKHQIIHPLPHSLQRYYIPFGTIRWDVDYREPLGDA